MISIEAIADSVLANAIGITGQQITTAIRKSRRHRNKDDLAIAQWFDSYQLTSQVLDLPALPPEVFDQLGGMLRTDEVQAAVHDLIAVRFARGTALEARLAREAFCLTLTAVVPEAAGTAEMLVDYYDDQLRELAARFENQEPELMEHIRDDALPTRIVAILHAIERHAAALSSRPAMRSEARFIASYRKHVIEEHGKLVPPDFDRRRLVPVREIYVPTVIIEEDPAIDHDDGSRELDVWQLAERIQRTVLLGDPGGGKTTAAKVLMHHFASTGLAAGRHQPVPFLVTLREYAAKSPPERSVVRHIEHELDTFYQCPAPPGLVDLLLLTGRAVVIFDGLDELLDTSRRQDVAARVERFCTEYPLTAILVTSRLIGYDQARLDEGRFSCYRLAGFGDGQVGDYVRKWFAQEKDASPNDAEAFLQESAGISDIRSNPLLLALLCILYRGAGSLPRNRVEVYEQCTNLLFRRWDARRKIHQELQAGHLLESTLRHFANWLLLRDNTKSAVTERELVKVAAEFLCGRGFESIDAAIAAAKEFVEFCCERIWVFSDAGTTADGEKLYAFTHRTFLEYFAAAHLAFGNDTPEQLAMAIIDRIAHSEWLLVAELALQIKDRTCNDGAQRAYAKLLSESSDRPHEEQDAIMRFLALCLRSVDPSPKRVRQLTRNIIEHAAETDSIALASTIGGKVSGIEPISQDPKYLALPALLINTGSYREMIADEIDVTLALRIKSHGSLAQVSIIRLMASMPYALPTWDSGDPEMMYWQSRVARNVEAHRNAVIAAAETDSYIRFTALSYGFITTRMAISMPGGPTPLFRESYSCFACYRPYFFALFRALDGHWTRSLEPRLLDDFADFGEYLRAHPQAPWIRGRADYLDDNADPGDDQKRLVASLGGLNPAQRLGAAAIVAILTESLDRAVRQPVAGIPDLIPYQLLRRDRISGRRLSTAADALPRVPVPQEFDKIFRKWAGLEISVTGIAPRLVRV